jgi:hypothetical protein
MSSPDDKFAPPGSRDDTPTEATPTVPNPAPPTEATPTVPDPAPPTDVVPPPTTPPAGQSNGPAATPLAPPTQAATSNGKTIALAVLATLTAVAVIGGAFLLGRSGDDPTPSTTSADVSSTTTTTVATTTTQEPVTTTTPTTAAPPPSAAPIGDVRQEAPGLFCRDLEARGYSYSAAVDYWRINGQPNQMDADKNGIPCETVYPRADVIAYWPQSTYDLSVSYGLPGGLLCRDLQAQGVGVYDALRYYIWEGYPTRMDADGNGIPCETVYPDAAAIWLMEF